MQFIQNDKTIRTLPQNTTVYEEDISYLCINSSDRDTSKYPKVNDYKINLNKTFKNIVSIEIISGSFANKNSILDNPYILVQVDGIENFTFSNNNASKGFATLYLKNTTGAHVLPDIGCTDGYIKQFKTPVASLSSIAVKLLSPDGTLFDFGESDGDTSIEFQNSLVFRIKTNQVCRNQLQQMSVYY